MGLLDHLVISCEKLADGQVWAEERLGVSFQPGGRHALFGTHNALLGLGQGLYVEVIAPDPEAPQPEIPRWFGLDRFSGKPRLTHWVCRTDDLAQSLNEMPEAGRAMPLLRGDFRWLMGVTLTGMLPFDGLFPALLEWQGPHPTERIEDSGCRLKTLTISHPRALTLMKRLRHRFDDPKIKIVVGVVGITAEIETPGGVAKL